MKEGTNRGRACERRFAAIHQSSLAVKAVLPAWHLAWLRKPQPHYSRLRPNSYRERRAALGR